MIMTKEKIAWGRAEGGSRGDILRFERRRQGFASMAEQGCSFASASPPLSLTNTASESKTPQTHSVRVLDRTWVIYKNKPKYFTFERQTQIFKISLLALSFWEYTRIDSI